MYTNIIFNFHSSFCTPFNPFQIHWGWEGGDGVFNHLYVYKLPLINFECSNKFDSYKSSRDEGIAYTGSGYEPKNPDPDPKLWC